MTRPDAALPRPSRIMPHAFLHDAEVPLPRLGNHFGVDEKIGGLQVNGFQDLPAKQLERAVDVADARAKTDADEPVVSPRQQAAQHGVVSVDPKADGDVSALHRGHEIPQLAQVELTIAVGVEDQIASRGVEPGPQRGAVAAVFRKTDQTNSVVLLARAFNPSGGGVVATVVHNDDLPGGSDGRGSGTRFLERALDVVLLVIGGQNNGKGGWRHPGRPWAEDDTLVFGAWTVHGSQKTTAWALQTFPNRQ